jgi:hypothetical protein
MLMIVLALGPPLLAWLLWPEPAPLEGFDLTHETRTLVLKNGESFWEDTDGKVERAIPQPITTDR